MKYRFMLAEKLHRNAKQAAKWWAPTNGIKRILDSFAPGIRKYTGGLQNERPRFVNTFVTKTIAHAPYKSGGYRLQDPGH